MSINEYFVTFGDTYQDRGSFFISFAHALLKDQDQGATFPPTPLFIFADPHLHQKTSAKNQKHKNPLKNKIYTPTPTPHSTPKLTL